MEIEVNEEIFATLLKDIKRLKPKSKEIRLGSKFTLIFRYCMVEIGDTIRDEVQLTKIEDNVKPEDVKSIVFDVRGLDRDYITQVSISREENKFMAYILPDRDEKDLKSLWVNLNSVEA